MKIIRLLRKAKMNSKGMTLVEVLVAMTILTIVAVPTLRIFGSAANTNTSSRMRQRATIVGESVMESFKAYNMESLCKQFRSSTFKGVTDSGSTTMSVTAMINGVETSPFRPDDELDQNATSYTFKANDVISEGQHYDVVVEASPAVQPEVLRMDSPNAYSDAIIKFDSNFNSRIVNEAVKQAKIAFLAANSTLNEGAITDVEIKNFKRIITVYVTDDGNSQQVSVSVDCTADATVSYRYLSGVGTAYTTDTYVVPSSAMTWSVTLPDASSTDTTMTVYDNSATIAGTSINGKICKLNQIYLYYYPGYERILGDGAVDEIVLDASLTTLYDPSISSQPEAEGYMPLRFNVAKQVDASLSETELNVSEVSYSASVTGSITGSGKAILISNFDKNLSDKTGVISPVPVSGFSDAKTYETGVVNEVELLYNLAVHVYRHDTGEEVATFVGTKND